MLRFGGREDWRREWGFRIREKTLQFCNVGGVGQLSVGRSNGTGNRPRSRGSFLECGGRAKRRHRYGRLWSEAGCGLRKRRGATLPAAVQSARVLHAATDNERTLPWPPRGCSRAISGIPPSRQNGSLSFSSLFVSSLTFLAAERRLSAILWRLHSRFSGEWPANPVQVLPNKEPQ